MSEEKIVPSAETVEQLRKLIKKEVNYITPEYPFERKRGNVTYGHKSEEDALKRLKQAWIEEQQKRSEWMFCPHCDKRLDIARNVVTEHKEAVARLRRIQDYVNEVLKYDLHYTYTKNYPITLDRLRDTVQETVKRLNDHVHGLGDRRRYYYPEERTNIAEFDEDTGE